MLQPNQKQKCRLEFAFPDKDGEKSRYKTWQSSLKIYYVLVIVINVKGSSMDRYSKEALFAIRSPLSLSLLPLSNGSKKKNIMRHYDSQKNVGFKEGNFGVFNKPAKC